MPATLRHAALLFVLSGCAGGKPAQSPEPSNSDQTRARIENRASLDMDIFVRRNDGVVSRLGLAPANETTTFALPTTLTAGAAWVRFEARPVRQSGQSVVSDPFPVKMGDELNWSVSPQ
jgi:hypothetical protein